MVSGTVCDWIFADADRSFLRYDAAGLFCIGVAVGFCFRFFRWNYFRRILITGILSVLLSVLPMAAGVAMGKGLQGSLYWGMNVITGDKSRGMRTQQVLYHRTVYPTV